MKRFERIAACTVYAMKIMIGICFFVLNPDFQIYVSAHPDDSVRNETNNKIKVTGYPAASFSPETSLAFGAAGFLVINRTDSMNGMPHRPSSVSPYFLYTLKKQFLSAIDIELYMANGYTLNSTFRFFNYPDYFYGTGRNTNQDRQLFTDKFFKWEGSIFRNCHTNLFYGLTYEWSFHRIINFAPSPVLITGDVAGYEGGNLIGLGPVFRIDNRDNIFYPIHGIYFETSWIYYPNFSLNDYHFNTFKIDLRYFHKVFSDKNILAFQFYYRQATGQEVPFYKLPQLGGDSRLRGIEHENRYRDKHAYYFQIEGRQELFWRLGGVLFAGAGNVSDHFSDSPFKKLKFIYGIGGRFRPFKDEKLNLRLDLGKGPGTQYGIYFSIREAF